MARKRILTQFDEVAVLPLACAETGVRIPGDGCQTQHAHIARQQEIELADRLRRIGDGNRRIEMRYVVGGIDPRIGAARSGQGDRLAQERGERPFERLLHRRLVGLPLPAAVGRPEVSQFHEITHGAKVIKFGRAPFCLRNFFPDAAGSPAAGSRRGGTNARRCEPTRR